MNTKPPKDYYNDRNDKLMVLIKAENKLCNQLFKHLDRMLDLAVVDALFPILSRYTVYH